MSLTREAVLDEFRAAGALLEGHFILTSGRRSPFYLQCARVLMDPARAERLCTALAARIQGGQAGQGIDAVVAPAMGGILVGYELARALGCLSLFTERVEGSFTLRRGFALEPGDRVLIAEDVVTTGLSLRECADAVRATGAVVVGAASLIDRSNGKADIGMKLTALATVDFPTYAPEEVPADLAAIPATKPGSRGLK